MHLCPHTVFERYVFGAFLYTRTSLTCPIMANTIDNTQDALLKDTATLTIWFHEHIHSKDCALCLLQQNKILRTTMQCPGKSGRSCGKPMRLYRKRENKKYDVWRCNTCACHKKLSLRAGCAFFSFATNEVRHKSSLPLTQLLEIVWLFLFMKGTVRNAAQLTKHSTHTIVNSWGMCRQVCTGIMELQPKFVGSTGGAVQFY